VQVDHRRHVVGGRCANVDHTAPLSLVDGAGQ
jgi:hypothetical protein